MNAIIPSLLLAVLGLNQASMRVPPFLAEKDVCACTFGSDESLISSTSKGEVCFWSLRKAALIKCAKIFDGHVSDIHLLHDGKTLIGRVNFGSIVVCEIKKSASSRLLELGIRVSTVAPTPDNKGAIFGCADGSIRIYDLATEKQLLLIERPGRLPKQAKVCCVSASGDGTYIAVGYGGFASNRVNNIYVWNTKSLITEYECRVEGVRREIAFSKSGPSRLFISGIEPSFLSELTIGDKVQSKCLEISSSVTHLTTSPVGSLLAFSANDRSVQIIDKGKAKKIYDFVGLPITVYDIMFSPDGSFLAIKTYNLQHDLWEIYIWDIKNGSNIRQR